MSKEWEEKEMKKSMSLLRQRIFGGIDVTDLDPFDHENYNIEFYNTVAIEGKVKIEQPKENYCLDWYFEEKKGQYYNSEILENPTWMDLAKEAYKQQVCNNDLHHIYLEDYEILREENGIKIISLSMGS